MSRVPRVTPRKQVVSTHLTGSPNRGWMKRRPAHAKNIAALFEILMSSLHSHNHR